MGYLLHFDIFACQDQEREEPVLALASRLLSRPGLNLLIPLHCVSESERGIVAGRTLASAQN